MQSLHFRACHQRSQSFKLILRQIAIGLSQLPPFHSSFLLFSMAAFKKASIAIYSMDYNAERSTIAVYVHRSKHPSRAYVANNSHACLTARQSKQMFESASHNPPIYFKPPRCLVVSDDHMLFGVHANIALIDLYIFTHVHACKACLELSCCGSLESPSWQGSSGLSGSCCRHLDQKPPKESKPSRAHMSICL